MPSDRRQARILAMQALCQFEAQQDESPEALEDLFVSRDASRSASRYATKLVEGYWARRDRADEMIAQAAERWELSRISMVDRNIMRVAIVELLERKVPPKVAVNEAVEIGREYGGEDSPRFINGVLDKVLKTMSGGDP